MDLTLPKGEYQLLLIHRLFGNQDPSDKLFDKIRSILRQGGLLYFDFVDASRSRADAGTRPISYWLRQLAEVGWPHYVWFEDDAGCHCL